MTHKIDPNSPVVRFSQRVRAASNRGSKDVSLSIAEAVELSTAITTMSAREAELLADIVELQKRLLDGPTEIHMDGGQFDPKT